MPTYQYRKDSRKWCAWVRVRPFKPVSRTFSSKEEAKAWAEDHERELKAHRGRSTANTDLTRLTVAGLATRFLEDPETRALRYYDDLAALLAWWVNQYGSTRVLRLGALTLREGRDKLLVDKAPATTNRYLSAMRSAWNWGRAAELIPLKLTWPSRLMLTEPQGRTRYLDDDELTALLEAAAAHSPLMRAAILVSIGCGLRKSELLRLRWADVDTEKQRVRVLLSKNDDARSVYLPASAGAALKALKRAPIIGQRVFLDDEGTPLDKSALEYRWRLVRKAAGLRDFRWHDLRHSCASFLAQQGANLLEIGSVLGHRSTSVTRRYAHLVAGAPVTGHTKLDEKLSGKP